MAADKALGVDLERAGVPRARVVRDAVVVALQHLLREGPEDRRARPRARLHPPHPVGVRRDLVGHRGIGRAVFGVDLLAQQLALERPVGLAVLGVGEGPAQRVRGEDAAGLVFHAGQGELRGSAGRRNLGVTLPPLGGEGGGQRLALAPHARMKPSLGADRRLVGDELGVGDARVFEVGEALGVALHHQAKAAELPLGPVIGAVVVAVGLDKLPAGDVVA